MTDQVADDRVDDTATNHQWRDAVTALAATTTATDMIEARVMVAAEAVRTSGNNDDESKT